MMSPVMVAKWPGAAGLRQAQGRSTVQCADRAAGAAAVRFWVCGESGARPDGGGRFCLGGNFVLARLRFLLSSVWKILKRGHDDSVQNCDCS